MSDLRSIDEAFSSFERTAFRLEALTQYLVDYERPVFEAFLRGERMDYPTDSMDNWVSFIETNKRLGKRMQRVHPMPDPLTDYLRFEIEMGYSKTIPAGEEVNVINSSAFEELVHKHGWQTIFEAWNTRDFWLFDDTTLFLMDYEPDGTFLGVRPESNQDDIATAITIRDTLLDCEATSLLVM